MNKSEPEIDLPDELRTELRTLSLASDAKLWEIVHNQMDKQRQQQLEQLANRQKARALTVNEQTILAQILKEAELVMLRKAEAFAVLAQRGYTVFPNTPH